MPDLLHACRPVKPDEVKRMQELLSDLHESFQVPSLQSLKTAVVLTEDSSIDKIVTDLRYCHAFHN